MHARISVFMHTRIVRVWSLHECYACMCLSVTRVRVQVLMYACLCVHVCAFEHLSVTHVRLVRAFIQVAREQHCMVLRTGLVSHGQTPLHTGTFSLKKC